MADPERSFTSGLLHVNHACVLLQHGGRRLLCDPWMISPAFGGWVQHPGPSAEAVRDILSGEAGALSVVVSHGHDDHLDEALMQTVFSGVDVYAPRFRSAGLMNRLLRLTGRAPHLLEDEPLEIDGGWRLSRLVNDDFTSFDAIVAIETDAFTVIHANDNWHAQPAEVIAGLSRIKTRATGSFVYLSQIGLADCFPQAYPQYSEDEVMTVARQRIVVNVEAALRNMEALGLERLYVYANQTRIISQTSRGNVGNASLVPEVLADLGVADVIRQLRPGDRIDLSSETPSLHPSAEPGVDLLTALLSGLESQFAALAPTLEPGPVRFALLGEELGGPISTPGVHYCADRLVWSRILSGQLTIEAITIGGAGQVFKAPRDANIRLIHDRVGAFGYFVQSRLLKDGFGWLL